MPAFICFCMGHGLRNWSPYLAVGQSHLNVCHRNEKKKKAYTQNHNCQKEIASIKKKDIFAKR